MPVMHVTRTTAIDGRQCSLALMPLKGMQGALTSYADTRLTAAEYSANRERRRRESCSARCEQIARSSQADYIYFISEMFERYCFETEVANRQDRFYRKLAMMNSPLFIPFIDSND